MPTPPPPRRAAPKPEPEPDLDSDDLPEGGEPDDEVDDLAEELSETGLDVSEASALDADNVLADEESSRVQQAPD